MRMRRALATAAAACAAATLLISGSAGTAYAAGEKFTVRIAAQDVGARILSHGNVCHIDVQVLLQEFGQHGVDQFKYRARIFTGDVADWEPDYLGSIFRDSTWHYSGRFPDDTRNFYLWWHNTHDFVMLAGHYTVQMRVVAVRPSLWKPDIARNIHPGMCVLTDAAINPK